MKWQRWHVVAAAAALGIAAFVGFHKSAAPVKATDAGLKDESLPVAPPDLLADLVLTTPNGSWKKLQVGIGGAAGLLPTTLPGLLITQTDLDMNLAAECDGASPMYGVVAGPLEDPALAVAVKLLDARRTKSLLTGEGARFVAKDAPGMTLLTSTKPGARRFELAITENGYLLVARRAPELGALGPYVTRTLPARPVPQESFAFEVPRAALQAKLAPSIAGLWRDGKAFLLEQDARMRAAKGRAPDFGDPAAIVAALDGLVSGRIAILGDLEKLKVTVDVIDDAMIANATLTPVKEDGPAKRWIGGMTVGDAAPVLAMAATSALALSVRDDEAARAQQAADVEKGFLAALGSRLTEPAKVHELFEGATKARDESAALAVSADEPWGVFVRAPVRDAEAAERAIRSAGELVKGAPFKDLFHVRDVTSGSEDIAGLGKAATLLVSRVPEAKPKGHDAALKPSGVAWTLGERVLSLGAGPEPLVTLRLGAKPDRKLADEPALKRFVTSIGADASTVLVVQPLRFDAKSANLPIAPLGIAVGRKGADATVRVDIADGILHELARRELGF